MPWRGDNRARGRLLESLLPEAGGGALSRRAMNDSYGQRWSSPLIRDACVRASARQLIQCTGRLSCRDAEEGLEVDDHGGREGALTDPQCTAEIGGAGDEVEKTSSTIWSCTPCHSARHRGQEGWGLRPPHRTQDGGRVSRFRARAARYPNAAARGCRFERLAGVVSVQGGCRGRSGSAALADDGPARSKARSHRVASSLATNPGKPRPGGPCSGAVR